MAQKWHNTDLIHLQKREAMDATHDELDFEEDFADDDERMDMLGRDAFEDEETRELEQRLRDEMRRAEAEDEDDVDEAPEDNRLLTGTGKQMKKIMKALGKRDGNEAYESDEENPYASDESEDEEMAVANPEKALEEAREERIRREKEEGKKEEGSRPGSRPTSRGGTPGPAENKTDSKPSGSRAQSPGAAAASSSAGPQARATSPSRQVSFQAGSGHASVAQRATSPPRGQAQRSRPGSRATSPGPSFLGPGQGATSTSPTSPAATGSKRKTDGSDVGSDGGAAVATAKRPRTSSARSQSPPGSPASPRSRDGSPPRWQAADIEPALVEMLRTMQNVTTHDVVNRFRAVLKDPELKDIFSATLKKVSKTATDPRDPTKKILVLREGF